MVTIVMALSLNGRMVTNGNGTVSLNGRMVTNGNGTVSLNGRMVTFPSMLRQTRLQWLH